MKYFFDFDDFFLKTENALVPDFFDFLSKITGATQEEIRQTYQRFSSAHFVKGTPYSPEQHIDFLSELRSFDRESIREKARAFFVDLRKYVFDGAETFLQSLPQEEVYLITYGAETFQHLKVDGSGLRKYFREVIVVQGNKPETIGQIAVRDHFLPQESVIFVDNRCGHFAGTRERGIITVHLKRPTDPYSKEPCGECQYVVSDFEALSQVLKSIES